MHSYSMLREENLRSYVLVIEKILFWYMVLTFHVPIFIMLLMQMRTVAG